jgi:hypothetical protein
VEAAAAVVVAIVSSGGGGICTSTIVFSLSTLRAVEIIGS